MLKNNFKCIETIKHCLINKILYFIFTKKQIEALAYVLNYVLNYLKNKFDSIYQRLRSKTNYIKQKVKVM